MNMLLVVLPLMGEDERMRVQGGDGGERRAPEWLFSMVALDAGKRRAGVGMGWGMERGWEHLIVEVSQRWKGL